MQVISPSAKLPLKCSCYRQNDRNTLWKPRQHAFIALSNQSNASHSAVENGKRSADDLRAPGVIIQRRPGFDRFTMMAYCVLAKPVLSGLKEARGEIDQESIRDQLTSYSDFVELGSSFGFSCTFGSLWMILLIENILCNKMNSMFFFIVKEVVLNILICLV